MASLNRPSRPFGRGVRSSWGGVMALAGAAATGVAGAGGEPGQIAWRPIVTTTDLVPGTEYPFRSFNQPSINRRGTVVFRARATGTGGPISGIFTRRIAAAEQPIEAVFLRRDEVPQPNNTDGPGGDGLASFNEFPSIPRIDRDENALATRAQSTPVWTTTLADGSETRVGTSGVYVASDGDRITGASLLGAVLDPLTGDASFPYYSVPGAPVATRFDQFPGAPAITDGDTVVFKGNWTDPDTSEGRTGIYFRDVRAEGGASWTRRIVSSDMPIPGYGLSKPVDFGSTAPPSAEDGTVVFLGVDSEESPTLGGIYAAPLADDPPLTPVAMIGAQVPGEPEGTAFARIGEALAFDGRWVGFWAAWGEETNGLVLECPDEGNEGAVQYCHEQHPKGYATSVPVHQGIFVADLVSGTVQPIVKTNPEDPEAPDDFVYWVFSGRAPGAGGGGGHGGGGHGGGEGEGEGGGTAEEDGSLELARWRSASFIAVSGVHDGGNGAFRVAYKATRDGVDGIFVASGGLDGVGTPTVVAEVGMPGSAIDAAATDGMLISGVALERESLRGNWMAIGASMLDPVTSEARSGLYAQGSTTAHADVNGDGRSEQMWLQRPSGRLAVWEFPAFGQVESRLLAASVPSDLAWRGDGDFDGDGDRDLLWQHASNGALWIWWMAEGELESVTRLDHAVPEGAAMLGVADVDGDGREDILLRSGSVGAVTAWLMAGAERLGESFFGNSVGLDCLALEDLDSDGSAEILWRDRAGRLTTWSLRIGSTAESAPVATVNPVGSVWRLATAGDFDGDGRTDLVWRHATLGIVTIWQMDGAERIETFRVLEAGRAAWRPVSAPDLDGDGRADLLWRHQLSGDVRAWRMDGFTVAESAFLRRVGSSWRTLR